jgi:hypothetical protein
MKRRSGIALLLGTGVSACAIAPRRIENPPAGPIPESQPIEVWRDGSRTLVRHLTVDGDSLRAVPEPRPADCDSCVVRYAVEDVDSLRYPRNQHAAQVATAVPIAVLSAVTFIWGMAGSD